MTECSDPDVLNRKIVNRKRSKSSKNTDDSLKQYRKRTIKREDSGRDSDDSLQQYRKKRKGSEVPRTDTNNPPSRVMGDVNGTTAESEDLKWKDEDRREISGDVGDGNDTIVESEDLHWKNEDKRAIYGNVRVKEEDLQWKDEDKREIYGNVRVKEEEEKPFTCVSEKSENSNISYWGAYEEIDIMKELYNLYPKSGASATTDIQKNKTIAASVVSLKESPVSGTPTSTDARDAEEVSSTQAHSANCMSNSKDAQSEECPICSQKFTTQEIGSPESCDHSFCVGCLEEWTNYINVCPLDQQMFKSILVRRCLGGEVVRRIEHPGPQIFPIYCEACGQGIEEDPMFICWQCTLFYHSGCLDSPMDDNIVPLEERLCPNCAQCTLFNPNEELKCVVCEERDGDDRKVFCEECCLYFHLKCLIPPMDETVPREEWFCPQCSQGSTLVTFTEILNSLCSP